jgi:hypothetical protein
MFRQSFTAAKVALLATAVGISACSGPGSQMVADAACHSESASSPDAAVCWAVPRPNRWDPSESGIARPGVYYQP